MSSASRCLPYSNPLRPWLWHKCLAGVALAVPLSVLYSYATASYTRPPDSVASPLMVSFLYSLPLNALSRAFGNIASSEYLPVWVHQRAIRTFIYLYGIDFPEEGLTSYRTLQQFFTREHSTRRVVSHLLTDTVATSPCDGELVRVIPIPETTESADVMIEQVKGCSFRLSNFLQREVLRCRESERRVCLVFHLRPGDYHRFHAPVDFNIMHSVHIPGALLPVTSTALRWLPRLLVSNERVVLQGEKCSLVAVGATNVGSVRLDYDQRVKTNRFDVRTHAVHYDYNIGYHARQGECLGHFAFGSCVVLLLDIPKELPMLVKEGQEVCVGMPLFGKNIEE